MLIFKTIAVDTYNENVWHPENYQNYGYGECGQRYEGRKLSVAYPDINSDGISDIILEGKANILCRKEIKREMNDYEGAFEDGEVKVSETPIKETYLWDKNSRIFAESI